MLIPHSQLSPASLRAVVAEFVSRDGTDHSSVERRIETVLRQLVAGQVELNFDVETQTCNLRPVGATPTGVTRLVRGANNDDGPNSD